MADTVTLEPLAGFPTAGEERAEIRREARRAGPARRNAWVPGADRLEPGWPGILDRLLINLPGLDRRAAARQAGIVLTPAERHSTRRAIGAALGCGGRYAAFRRFETVDGVTREHRLACQLACGNRVCPACDERRRKRESWRVMGPWQMFLTLTLPYTYGTPAGAWRKIHRTLALFLKRLRRASGESDTWPLLSSQGYGHCLPQSGDENADSMARAADLEYAWVLEPHKSGRPHVHLVLNCEWVDYEWVISQWREVSKCSTARVYGERIKSRDGVCAYLAKYISKASLSSDILGILRRRRLWACTLPVQAKPEPRWTREARTTADEAWSSILLGRFDSVDTGWTVDHAKEGAYSIWSRVVTSQIGNHSPDAERERELFVISTDNEGRTTAHLEPESLAWLDEKQKPPWHKYC